MSEYSSQDDIAALKRGFRAASLSTPLKRAESVSLEGDVETALNRLRKMGFDQAPVKAGSKLVGWIRTKDLEGAAKVADSLQRLEDAVLVSAETSLSNAIDKLSHSSFVFTVSETGIVGFICPSDLERHVVRAYFSMLTSQVEMLLGYLVKWGCPEELVREQLRNESTKEGFSLKQQYERQREKGEETHPVEYLYLGQLVDLFEAANPDIDRLLLKNLQTKLTLVVENRNLFAHSTRRINSRINLRRLDEAYSFLIKELIVLADRKNEQRSKARRSG